MKKKNHTVEAPSAANSQALLKRAYSRDKTRCRVTFWLLDPIFVALAPGRGNEVPRTPGREKLGGCREGDRVARSR